MPLVAPFDAIAAKAGQETWAKHLNRQIEEVNSIGMKLVLIPPGEFTMGSPEDEPHHTWEEVQVAVKLTSPFLISTTEVTQGQWSAAMETTPWRDQSFEVEEGSDNAASYVSWDDATKFCQNLTESELAAGRISGDATYRLPTEAEWEWACRSGTTTAYSFGEDESDLGEYAWWGGDMEEGNAHEEQYPHHVGQKRANAFGLFDMPGNVEEWCADWFDGKSSGGADPTGPSTGFNRTTRGGSWYVVPQYARSASRMGREPKSRYNILGFRIALSLPKK